MKKIKEFTVKCTYEVTFKSKGIPNSVYNELVESYDSMDVLDDYSQSEASEWLRDNISESDAEEWKYEITNVIYDWI